MQALLTFFWGVCLPWLLLVRLVWLDRRLGVVGCEQNEQAMRLHIRQTNEFKTQIKTLSGEAESVRLQQARMQDEAVSSQRTNDKLRDDLHAAEKTNIVIRGDKEDEIHGLRNEIRGFQTRAMKAKSEAEREQKLLKETVDRSHNQVEVLERALQSATSALSQKDRDASNQIHKAREQEWEKYRDLEKEKMELEGQLRETERTQNSSSERYIEKEQLNMAEIVKLRKELETVSFERNSLREEFAELNAKMTEQTAVQDRRKHVEADLDKEKKICTSLNKKVASFEVQLEDCRARLLAREQDLDQIQQETEKHGRDSNQLVDELRRQLGVVRTNAEIQAKQYFEELHKLNEKYRTKCDLISEKHTKHKSERRMLRALVASTEEKLSAQVELKQQIDLELRERRAELDSFRRNVDTFGSAMHDQAHHVFDEAMGKENSKDKSCC